MILVFAFTDAAEAEKFEYLYWKYKNHLYMKAWDILHDEMAAEDALSETMIRVYHNMEKIGDPESPECAGFLTTIARNVSLTLYKKRASGPVPYAMGIDADDDENFEDQEDPFDLESSVLDGMSAERLFLIIKRLDEESRNIFVLKYAYDLSHREIAEQMKITENNVTVRLHRAKKKLAAMIEKEGLDAG